MIKFKNYVKAAAVACCAAVLAAGLAGCGGTKQQAAASSASSGTAMKVIIGTTGQGARWTETADSGKGTQGLQGFAIDLWNEIGKRNGWEIQYRQGDFAGLWGMLDNGQIDSIASNISQTEARMEKYYFSEPFYVENSVFLYKGSLGDAKDLDFFKGRKIAVGAPTSSRLVLDDFNAKKGLNAEGVNVDTQGEVVPNVLAGISEAGLVDKSVATTAIHDLKADLKIYDPQYRVMACANPFIKTDKGKKLMEGANKAIAEMKKDGTLKQIAEKWLYDDLSSMPKEFWDGQWDQTAVAAKSAKLPD